jgi:hypothetical protein
MPAAPISLVVTNEQLCLMVRSDCEPWCAKQRQSKRTPDGRLKSGVDSAL